MVPKIDHNRVPKTADLHKNGVDLCAQNRVSMCAKTEQICSQEQSRLAHKTEENSVGYKSELHAKIEQNEAWKTE